MCRYQRALLYEVSVKTKVKRFETTIAVMSESELAGIDTSTANARDPLFNPSQRSF